MIFCCFDAFFWEIHRELLFLVKKETFSESSTEILRKLVFLTYLKGVNPEENVDLFKQQFLIKPEKLGKYLQKRVFFLKVSHIQLNYAFLLFWSIFGEITDKFSYYSKKWLCQNGALKFSEFVFLKMFEKLKSWGIFGFV